MLPVLQLFVSALTKSCGPVTTSLVSTEQYYYFWPFFGPCLKTIFTHYLFFFSSLCDLLLYEVVEFGGFLLAAAGSGSAGLLDLLFALQDTNFCTDLSFSIFWSLLTLSMWLFAPVGSQCRHSTSPYLKQRVVIL